MASIDPHPTQQEQKDWNEAYDRVTDYLDGFALGDRAHVSRVALSLLDEARRLCRENSAKSPTETTMDLAQKRLADWLATNLEERDKAPSQIMADGSVALLLSRVFQTSPASFLDGPLPEELRHALREKLVVAGPDLNISRMTPRHLDYGPMLDIARQTWHRWEFKRIAVAVCFWTGIYFLFYWWLSHYSL